MNSKTINILTTSIFLLAFGFAVLVGQNIKQDEIKTKTEIKADFRTRESSGTLVLYSGQILVLEDEPKIWHSGFLQDDLRQKLVQEAYDLWGIGFVSLIECENGRRDPRATGDFGKSRGLCQLNTRWHKEPLTPEWNDWKNQLLICFEKWKSGTKFYWPSRKVAWKACQEAVKERFYFAP